MESISIVDSKAKQSMFESNKSECKKVRFFYEPLGSGPVFRKAIGRRPVALLKTNPP